MKIKPTYEEWQLYRTCQVLALIGGRVTEITGPGIDLTDTQLLAISNYAKEVVDGRSAA